MARIIQFEGRQISVPDDATDDEVAQIISTPAASAPEAEGPPELHTVAPPTSLVDTIMSGAGRAMGVVDRGVRGVANGLVNIATLPVEGAALTNAGVEYVGDKIGQIFGGDPVSNRTLSNLVTGDAPVAPKSLSFGTILNQANPLRGLARLQPYVGAKAVKDALNTANDTTADLFGVTRPRHEGDGIIEKGVERVGEEVGAAMVPVAAAINKGRQGVEAARKLPLLARMFVEPAAINPAKFASKEAGTAVAAGAGASALTQGAGTKEGTWQHAAADAGGALTGAGILGTARTVSKPIGDIIQAIFNRDKFNNRVVSEAATDTIANAASTVKKTPDEPVDTQPLVDAIMNGRRVEEAVPGFRESTADRTADPGLAALEYGRQSGPNSGLYTQRRGDNTAAIDNAMNALEPQGTPGALRSELELERTRRLTDAGVQTRNAEDAYAAATQRLQPALTQEGRGADLRAALEQASEAAREIVRRAWDPIDQSAARVDTAPLADQYGALDAGMSIAERRRFRPGEADIPGELAGAAEPPAPVNTGILDEFGRPITREAPALDTTAPINEITGLRSALTDAAREAATAGRTNEARIINQHVDALDAYLDNAIPAELRQQYDAARATTRDMADRFERPQTAIAQTLDRREGMYRQPDNAIPGKFVQPDSGRVADYRALMREAGADPRARRAVEDQLIADARARGVLERPDQLDEFLRERSIVLADFPQLRERFNRAGTTRRGLEGAQAAETELTRTLGTADRPGTSTVGQYLRYGDERAQDALKGVLAAKDPAKAADELLAFVNDQPAAVEGARKAFWDLMQTRTRSGGETTKTLDGVQPWMPRALKAFLDDPATAAVAERLYRDNPEHLADIRKIADALQGVDIRTRAKATNSSGTPQGVSNVLTPETVQSRFYAYKRGQTSFGFMITALASVAARRAVRGAQADAVEKLIDRAMLDPDLAATLLKENNPANRAAMARTAKAFLGNEASTLMEAINDDEKDPVKDAAMRGGK